MLKDILYLLVGLLGGAVIGFFVCKHYMQKYIKQNPPINEQMVKAMMSQMGRTPSQKQINQVMQQMKKNM